MKTNFVPLISKPCPANWNDMTGDDNRRFCEHCQLHVHNLTAMDETERVALLAGRTGRTCVAYVQTDATIAVRTGFWLWLQRLKLAGRAGWALAAATLPAGLIGCSTPNPATPAPGAAPAAETSHRLGKVAVPRSSKNPAGDGKLIAGGILAEDRPLWKRIVFFWRDW